MKTFSSSHFPIAPDQSIVFHAHLIVLIAFWWSHRDFYERPINRTAFSHNCVRFHCLDYNTVYFKGPILLLSAVLSPPWRIAWLNTGSPNESLGYFRVLFGKLIFRLSAAGVKRFQWRWNGDTSDPLDIFLAKTRWVVRRWTKKISMTRGQYAAAVKPTAWINSKLIQMGMNGREGSGF